MDFRNSSARLPCYLPKGPLKRDFLDTYVTTYFGVCKLKNKSAMMVILFLKMFKIECKFRKCKKQKKREKKLVISEIIESENVAKNCLF